MNFRPIISRIVEERGYLLKFIKKNIIYTLFKENIKSSEYSSFVKTISIIPTYKCNFSCVMCGNWRAVDTNLNNNNKLDLETYKELIDDVVRYKCNIVLTGGEPLLYESWYELSKYIKSKNLRLDLQTNGWMLDKAADKIIDVIDNLNVSVDGIQEIHNKIRKQRSFEKTISGLKKVDEIKKIKKKKRPYIIIVYTISNLNYEYLSQTVEYINKLNIEIDKVVFIHQMFVTKKVKEEYLNKFGNIFKMSDVFSGFTYVPEKIDITKLSEEIKKARTLSKKMSFNINFWPDLKGDDIKIYYDDIDKFPSVAPKTCITPFTEAFILPSGEVWICPLNITGNIKEENFSSLWNNEKTRSFRKQLITQGNFRICKNCCGLYA